MKESEDQTRSSSLTMQAKISAFFKPSVQNDPEPAILSEDDIPPVKQEILVTYRRRIPNSNPMRFLEFCTCLCFFLLGRPLDCLECFCLLPFVSWKFLIPVFRIAWGYCTVQRNRDFVSKFSYKYFLVIMKS